MSTAHATKGKLLFGASAYDEVNNRLGIGLTTPNSNIETTSTLGTIVRGVRSTQTSSDTVAAAFWAAKSRSGGALLSGDVIGNFGYLGHDGSAFAQQAGARCVATENWDGTHHGAKLRFSTTPVASITETTALEILSSGQIQNIISGNETTGGGSAALGTNSPAVTNTAPYKWLKFTTSDGSQGYIPVWK
jgi:hypothetical protein